MILSWNCETCLIGDVGSCLRPGINFADDPQADVTRQLPGVGLNASVGGLKGA